MVAIALQEFCTRTHTNKAQWENSLLDCIFKCWSYGGHMRVTYRKSRPWTLAPSDKSTSSDFLLRVFVFAHLLTLFSSYDESPKSQAFPSVPWCQMQICRGSMTNEVCVCCIFCACAHVYFGLSGLSGKKNNPPKKLNTSWCDFIATWLHIYCTVSNIVLPDEHWE